MSVSSITSRYGKTGFVIISVIAFFLTCSPLFVANENSSIVHKDDHRTVHSDNTDIHDHIDTRYSNTFIEEFDDFDNISAGNTTSVVKTDIGRVEMWGSPIMNGDFEDGDMTGWTLQRVQGNQNPTNLDVRSGSPDQPGDYYLYFYSSYQGGTRYKVISDPFVASANHMHYWFDGYDDDEFCYGFQIYEDNNPSNDHFFEDRYCSSWGDQGDGNNGGASGQKTKEIPSGLRGRLCRLAIWLGDGGSGDWGRMHMDNIWLSDASGNQINMNAELGGNLTHVQSSPVINTWTAVGAAKMTYYHYKPEGTDIIYNITADGENWDTVSNGTPHVFDHIGSQLMWNATLKTTHDDIAPYIDKIIIEYDFVADPVPNRPNSNVWVGTSTPKLEWNFTDPDPGDHQTDYIVEIYSEPDMENLVYNSSWVNSTNPDNIDVPEHVVREELDDGIYYWRVRTKDIYHAASNFSDLKRIMIDVTKPVGNVTIEGGALSVNEQLVTLEISASDNGSGIADMQITGDNGNQGPWEEFKDEKRVALSKDDGLKKIGIRFRDHAGIVSDSYNDTVYYDLKGPLEIHVTSLTHPDPLWYYNSTRPTFQWEPPPEITGIKGYSYMVDSSALTEPGKVLYKPNSEITQTFPGEFSGFKDGEWYFHITSCDTYDQWGNTTHFQFNIDTTSPEITDVSPHQDIWHDVTEIQASAVFQDMDGFGLDLESIMHSLKTEGGSFSKWTDQGIKVDILQSGIGDNPVKVRASVDISVKEGSDNAIRWQVNDLAGNGPVRSEITYIKVDQTPVTFSEPVPGEEKISLETDVSCGITITDAGSGVDGKTIEYSLSSWGSDEKHFLNWTTVNSKMIKDTVKVLLDIEFEPGRNNFIRWRARDVLGNGFALSAPSRVWVNSPPESVMKRPTEGEVVEEGAEIALSAIGSADNEDDELNFYWEIKNRTSKEVVFSGFSVEETAILKETGIFTVTLFVDDGLGFNVSKKVNIEIVPKKRDPVNNTGGGTNGDPASERAGIVQEWWWLMLIIAVVIILLVVIGLIFAGKRRKRIKETVETARSPPRIGQPYSMGGQDFYRPGYSEMRSSGGGSPYAQHPNKVGDPWGSGVPTHGAHHGFSPGQQMMTQSSTLPAYSGTHYGSRSQQITIPASESPYSDTSRSSFSQLPPPTSIDPKYSLPSFTTDRGSQDLNRMALPAATGEDSGNDPNMLSSNSPSDIPSAGDSSIPDPPKIPDAPSTSGSLIPDLPKIPDSPPPDSTEAPLQEADVSPPKVMEPSFQEPDASSSDIRSGEQIPLDSVGSDIPKETPSKGIRNDFLDEIFGGSSTSKDQLAQIENTTPEPPAAPYHDPLPPHFRTFQCHQCNTVNPVTSGIRPTVVTCAVCGAKGHLEK